MMKQTIFSCIFMDVLLIASINLSAQSEDIALPEMVYVSGGIAKMSGKYSVNLSSYYIGKYEVTRGQFEAFVSATDYKTQDDKDGKGWVYDGSNWRQQRGITWRNDVSGDKQANDHPVMRVSYEDAQAYCDWLSKKTGQKFDLPSEAQWQFAAMGGNSSKGYIYSGSNDLESVAWFWHNSDNCTYSVGGKAQNELGIYDMTGNVWEWCKDVYTAYPSGSFTNRIYEGRGIKRVNRGGSWSDYRKSCTNTYRGRDLPTSSNFILGFRLSRTE